MRSGSLSAAASVAAARGSSSPGRSITSDDDINASLALDDLVALEPDLRVGRAFAGGELVFPAVPGADDVRLVLVVGLAEERFVGAEQVDDLVADDALAGRPALMGALIAVGVEGAGMPVDADLGAVLADDANVTVFHLKLITDENLRHARLTPSRAGRM